jgi:hypothetical protein
LKINLFYVLLKEEFMSIAESASHILFATAEVHNLAQSRTPQEIVERLQTLDVLIARLLQENESLREERTSLSHENERLCRQIYRLKETTKQETAARTAYQGQLIVQDLALRAQDEAIRTLGHELDVTRQQLTEARTGLPSTPLIPPLIQDILRSSSNSPIDVPLSLRFTGSPPPPLHRTEPRVLQREQ